MCDIDGCNCMGDVYDLNDKIDGLNNKLDSLNDDVKDLKEELRDINKGKHKPLKKLIENYMDEILGDNLRDIRHDIRDLTDDVAELQRKAD